MRARFGLLQNWEGVKVLTRDEEAAQHATLPGATLERPSALLPFGDVDSGLDSFYASFYRPFYALYERFYDFYDFYNFYDWMAFGGGGQGPQVVVEEQPVMQLCVIALSPAIGPDTGGTEVSLLLSGSVQAGVKSMYCKFGQLVVEVRGKL
jgi:hypothetical protein